jgi:transposase, IS5 family
LGWKKAENLANILSMIGENRAHKEPQIELFRVELVRILDMEHPLVKLAQSIDWKAFEKAFAAMWHDSQGRPAIDTRLMVSLHYLKYTFDLSDEAVVEGWLQNPYWQHLSGMRYFEHEVPLDPSSMSRWRSRAGQSGVEELLEQTIRAGLRLKAIEPNQLERINVDTTVQEKHVRFPTDSRLYNRARERLVKEARKAGLPLRQGYERVGKILLMQQGRYAHARQLKRARRCQRKLRTILGRVIRDIERKSQNLGLPLDPFMRVLLERAKRIHGQKRQDKNKLYSVHAPEVECISKGKAHKRYEFGVKVSVATTSKGGWHVGALSCAGNPYDGHTLSVALRQVESFIAPAAHHVFVDMGYRKHDYQGTSQIHVDKKTRGGTARRLWRWIKRRAAIEPAIGHLKAEHRMERNRLWGEQGDMVNAILSAAGMNFRKLLKHAEAFWRHLLAALTRLLASLMMPSIQRPFVNLA